MTTAEANGAFPRAWTYRHFPTRDATFTSRRLSPCRAPSRREARRVRIMTRAELADPCSAGGAESIEIVLAEPQFVVPYRLEDCRKMPMMLLC